MPPSRPTPDAYVFTGPTLAADEARKVWGDAVYLPPVRQGDVYRTALLRPRAIGIVDGYFQHVPSVWHKEFLWAMARGGVHVFGAASMGALRAAELAPFGMHGVGRVFEAYRDGVLEPYRDEAFEDDDEVAVIHGPAETGYVALSEAMVNIRCTLARAQDDGVIGAATRDALVRAAKDLFYQERTYDRLLERAAGDPAPPRAEVEALRGWLPRGLVNRKRDDALAMLAAMREFLAADPGPMHVGYRFEHTTMWDRVETASELVPTGAGADGPGEALPLRDLLDELRLEGPGAFQGGRRGALLRLLALRECDRRRLTVGRSELRRHADRFRREAGLYRRRDVDRWLAENDLDFEAFDRLMEDDARLRELELSAGPGIERHVLDHLRLSGGYARLAARARDKRGALAAADLTEPEPEGSITMMLLAWYFERRLGEPVPDDVDAYAAELGFASTSAFCRALLREYLYATGAAAATGRARD